MSGAILEQEPDVTFRDATIGDTLFARGVHKQAYFDVITRQFGTWDDALQAKLFDANWNNPGFEIIYSGTDPCGYCRIAHLDTEIRAYELVLLPEFQGRGIGSFILRKTQEEARAQRLSVFLEVLKLNQAINLYTRLGFQQTGETDTHIQMAWHPTDVQDG